MIWNPDISFEGFQKRIENWYNRRFKRKIQKEDKKRRKNQTTFIHCPRCRNEMVANGRVVWERDGIVKYQCSFCGDISFWDFVSYPVPYLRTCGDCVNLKKDDFGGAYCPRNCAPDTQVCFECRKGEDS